MSNRSNFDFQFGDVVSVYGQSVDGVVIDARYQGLPDPDPNDEKNKHNTPWVGVILEKPEAPYLRVHPKNLHVLDAQAIPGAPGPAGPQGPQGERGPAGAAATGS